jgi:MFS family permease
MIVLSICLALQMTSYVMILPLFARRFAQLGAGAESLGTSALAYALAAALAAPFTGALADRFGRRQLVLVSLASYVLAFTGYLWASSAPAFIALRGLAGAFTAGLIPAVTGIVADLAPKERRAQWIGIVDGGASIGWMAGPVLGGVLYDRWGYAAALSLSIVVAMATFTIAFLAVPETRPHRPNAVEPATKGEWLFQSGDLKSAWDSFRKTLPGSLPALFSLLWVCFGATFAWAFIEPRFMFYAHDGLGWNASRLGLVMSTYGVAMTLGEYGLGQVSDRLGRRPVIALGLALFSAQFIGLAFFRHYLLIAATFVVAGLGNALFDPALSATILDIAPAQHQARLLGLKSTAGALGSIGGPALVLLFTSALEARGIFLAALGVTFLTVVVTLARPRRAPLSRAAVQPEISGGAAAYSNPD